MYSGTVISVNNSDAMRNIIVEIDIVNDSSSTLSLPEIKCSLSTPSLNPQIDAGDRISFMGTLDSITDHRDLPDEFDLVNHYKINGIKATSFVYPENILVTGIDCSLIWDIKRLRDDISHIIASLPLSENCIEFLNATITGDTSMLSEGQRIKYSTTGLAHVLALSGLHVGIITIIIAVTLFPFDMLRWRKIRYIITIILLWIYAIMTGLSPSVTRAVIMATIFLTAYVIQRNHSPFNSLCFAAIIILVFSPLSLHDIGFQLSFTAVASILLLADKINPINQRRRILYSLFSILTVSISAMLGTGIISAFYFHSFPVYFLLANIASSYLLPFIITGGVVSITLCYLGFDPLLTCIATDFIYSIIERLTTFITSLPGAEIDNIYFNAWIILPYFAVMASIYASLKYKRVFWYFSTGLLIIFTITISIISQPHFAKTEYYIPRDTYYTNIIVRDGAEIYLISTAHGGDSIDAINKFTNKYQDYMGRRDIDSVNYVGSKFRSKHISRNNHLAVIGKDVIAIIDNDLITSVNTKPRYAIVCRGFKGNIVEVYNTLAPDTIILSRDLHKKRIKRYIDSCQYHNIPYISLREKGFHRVIMQ